MMDAFVSYCTVEVLSERLSEVHEVEWQPRRLSPALARKEQSGPSGSEEGPVARAQRGGGRHGHEKHVAKNVKVRDVATGH